MPDKFIEFHVYINVEVDKGVKGYGLSWGEWHEWFATLSGAKNRAEYLYEIERWTRNKAGEYEAIGRVRASDYYHVRSMYEGRDEKPITSKLRERLMRNASPESDNEEAMTERELETIQRAFMEAVEQDQRRRKR